MNRALILLVLCVFPFTLTGKTNDETAQLILTLVKRSNAVPSFYTKYFKVKAWSVNY